MNTLETLDLNAARISRPPEVSKAPILTKDKSQKKVTKPTLKQQKNIHIMDSPMETEKPIVNFEHLDEPQPVVLTQPFAPKLPHQTLTDSNTKSIKRPSEPLSSRISYNVGHILDQNADIKMKDLLIVAPTVKRDLIRAIKVSTAKPRQNLSLNFFEDDDIDTTAIYTDFYINEIKVKTMLDTGSAKTCMSKDLADKLSLSIDSPSTSVFTLGNGTKQASLGIVYDVPLNLGGNIIIPGSIEVLPICPANLIVGNNWMKRAKAKLNLEEKVIKVDYKGLRARNTFSYTRSNPNPRIKSSQLKYTFDGNTNNNVIAPNLILETSDQNDSSEDEEEINGDEDDDDSEDDDLAIEPSDSESEMLLMLEDEYNEFDDESRFGQLRLNINPETDNFDITVLDNYFYITPRSERTYNISLRHLLKQDKLTKNPKYHVIGDITNPHFNKGDDNWTDSTSYIVQCQDKVQLVLVNDTDKTLVLEPDDVIADLEVIYMSDVEEFKAYKMGNLNIEELSNELCSQEIHEDFNHEEYEDKIKEKIDISNVPSDLKIAFLSLIHQFDHIFDWDNDKIGNIDVGEHVIRLKPNAVPKRVKPYRLSRLETESLQKEIDKLLRLGIIEKAGYSEWASPIIMLRKKDGTYRIVADFRYLNSQSEPMNYPLTNIDELLDQLSEAHWMSCFDLRSGFFQANISEQSKPLTTIVCSVGAFYFRKLAQGIASSPGAFADIMQRCFDGLINRIIVLYLDDVTTYSNSKDPRQHLIDLAATFTRMSQHGIVLNPGKCHFFKEEILFLGYIVTRNSIKPNPATIEKVKDFALPTTVKQVRSFLGLASYYRRFINGFARIARPLHEQLQTIKQIPWNDEATKAFYTLKEKLTSYPILRKPDFSKPFEVICDASILGLGAILTQRTEEGHEYPIIFSSRSLRNSEKNYGISKLELLAVVWSVQLYRPYLLGSQFQITIISDHSSLSGLLKTKQPTGILARWIEILSEYNFKIIYRKGKVNEAADFLSRLGY